LSSDEKQKIQNSGLMKTFAERLKFLIKTSGVKQKDLARAVGLPESTISSYTRGEKEPGVTKAALIARYFGVDLNWLILGESLEDRQHKGDVKYINVHDIGGPANVTIGYNIQLPGGRVVQERRAEYRAEHMRELIAILRELTPEQRKAVLQFIKSFHSKEHK